jgi:hypothetical protein
MPKLGESGIHIHTR